MASQKRTNARMDELEEKNATVELRKIMGDNSRVRVEVWIFTLKAKLMTSVLNNESIKELSENRLQKIGDIYVKVKKPELPPIVLNEFRKPGAADLDEPEQQLRAERLALQF